MVRHIGNLKRLHSKLTTRYGAEDDLVLQVTKELELLQAVESEYAFSFLNSKTLSKNVDSAVSQRVSAFSDTVTDRTDSDN